MPSIAMYRISPPSDFAEFEKICMDFLANKYDADASLYGRKGQAQQGIDIIVSLEDSTFICAQCKNVKAVTVEDLDKWIAKMDKECSIPMIEFLILVAIDNDAKLQEHVCKVSSQRSQDGQVPVKLFFWDDILHFIKKDLNMLRMYYPEFCQGQEVKLEEASKTAEEKYPERIRSEAGLRNLFFDEAVKYRVEEFLNSNPRNAVSIELVGYADAFVFSARKLLYRAPMLVMSNCYDDIEQFLRSFVEYCDFFPNVTEGFGDGVIATNKYGTKEEEADLEHNEKLRLCAIEQYEQLKNY